MLSRIVNKKLLIPRYTYLSSSYSNTRTVTTYTTANATKSNKENEKLIPYIAIVGSGPSGFYSAKYLLEKHSDLHVDMYDKLPTPFGLVRYGVAPDHPEVKSVETTFTEVATSPRFRYFGNVEICDVTNSAGNSTDDTTVNSSTVNTSCSSTIDSSNFTNGTNDNSTNINTTTDITNKLSLSNLMKRYTGVLLAYGASNDRKLNIPGEDNNGVYSAKDFVNWYNGHPYYQNIFENFNLDKVTDVVIIGQGNVALDCARILAKSYQELELTDITNHSLQLLKNKLRNVHNIRVIGRRGPAQSSFTIKELRELTRLSNGTVVSIDYKEFTDGMNDASKKEVADTRSKKRILELIETIALSTNDRIEHDEPVNKQIFIQYLLTPTKIIGDSEVEAIELERNNLVGEPMHQKAVLSGEKRILPCQLILKSVGYRSEPISTILPFDKKTSTVPHSHGRVILTPDSDNPETSVLVTDDVDDKKVVKGLYVTGWLKRGPTGIIGSNITDAKETVSAILEDLANEKLSKGSSIKTVDNITTIDNFSEDPASFINNYHSVSWSDHLRLDKEERRRGATLSPAKPREKIVDISEQLQIAKNYQ